MGCIGGGEKRYPDQTPQNTLKILCLGVGGSGKTTFIKHLKIINSVPWKPGEIDAFVKVIRGNYIKGMQDAVEGAKKLQLEFHPDNEEKLKQLDKLRTGVDLNDDTIILLKELWQDPAIHTVIERHSELLSVTHLAYFWDQMERVLQPSFIPNDEDILKARVRTAGANSSAIYIDKRYFEFWDVGGQKPERAKWEYVFSENKFSCIIYFVAVDEFDVDNEDRDTNKTKLEVSRFIFTELVNSDYCGSGVPVVLFLNRQDLFEARMKNPEGFRSFQNTFPQYSGRADKTEGMRYIQSLFTDVINGNASVTTHFTCALDRESLVIVWRMVKYSLLNETISEFVL